MFHLGGDEIVLYGGEYKKFFDVPNLGGEFVYFYFYICVSYCLYVFLSSHAVMCSFECFRKDRYILIKTFYLFLQLLG